MLHHIMDQPLNKRGAGNGAVALTFNIGRPGRAVPDHGR